MQIFSKLVVLSSWGLAFGFIMPNPTIAQLQPMVEVEPELAASILRMEMNLEQEYEQYFDRDFSQVEQTPTMMAQKLDYLFQMTGKKHAVMWVMPKEDYLHLVLITPGQTPVVKDLYDVPESKLRDTLQAFRNNITNPRRKINLYASQQLYQWIVSPFEEEVLETENIDSLIFCLGNGLRGLPIAALYDGEQYLVEKYSLSLIPGFNLMNGDYTTPGMGNGQRKITAMGASEFTNQNPLPAVPLELQAIVKPTSSRSNQATNSNTSDYYLNQNFTLNNLKSILATDNPDIVHIATHAEFTGENPENSYIQLWDRRLTMAEIGQITWAKPYLDLLVLSACQTSLGNDQAELGFAGIALQSGVKTALASLWSVSDLGTLAIMADFYGQLDRGTTKAEALRQSQLNMLRGDISLKEDQLNFPDRDLDLTETVFANNQSQTEEAFRFTHPYYWSAFTIVGSPW